MSDREDMYQAMLHVVPCPYIGVVVGGRIVMPELPALFRRRRKRSWLAEMARLSKEMDRLGERRGTA